MRKIEYIVKSNTPTGNNPDRCWHNISPDKLSTAAAHDKMYGFTYNIGGKKYAYIYPARKLQEIFESKEVRIKKNRNGKMWDFFGDYRTGKLYRTISCNDTDVLVELNPW